MNGYDALADLPLEIEAAELARHERPTSSGFTRVTTEIRLHGPEATGRGEGVTHDADLHDALQETGPPPLAGEYEFGTFSEVVGDLDLFPTAAPDREEFRHYRRWGFESAALDLALKQSDRSLAEALDTKYDPVRFLISTRLGDPPTADRLHGFLERISDAEFKLDPTSEWGEELTDEVAATDAVRILDLKGYYEGTEVDQAPDPRLYRQVLDSFPEAVVEDPAVTDETEPILDGEWDRLSWDAPIHDVENLQELPAAGWLNVKPSRFGSVEAVLEAFEHCRREDLGVYVGGQFELGPGRQHLHALASIFCPEGPNDAAPREYNDPDVGEGLARSPLSPTGDECGLEWGSR